MFLLIIENWLYLYSGKVVICLLLTPIKPGCASVRARALIRYFAYSTLGRKKIP